MLDSIEKNDLNVILLGIDKSTSNSMTIYFFEIKRVKSLLFTNLYKMKTLYTERLSLNSF